MSRTAERPEQVEQAQPPEEAQPPEQAEPSTQAGPSERWGHAGGPRDLRLVLPASLAVAGGALVAVALASAERTATLLADPGVGVRWGLPVAGAVHDGAAAVGVAALVLAAVVLPARSVAFARALLVGAAGTAAWTFAATAELVLTYASVSGTRLDSPAFGAELGQFVTAFEVGQSQLAVVVLTALATTVAFAARGATGAGWAALLALTPLLPLALAGHSGSAQDHETAVTSMGLHLLGVTVWVGGLVALVLLRPTLAPPALRVTVARFSGLALAAVLLVAVSGVLNAATRVESLGDLDSRYGMLVVAKTVLVVALAAVGLWHRRVTLPALGAGRAGTFWRLVAVELVVMGVTIGLAVGLSTTAPPVSETTSPVEWTAAEVLIGYDMPPEQSAVGLLTQWRPDVLWLLLAAAGAGWYLWAVRRLRARGDRWPAWRLLSWLVGIAVVVAATSSGLSTYGRVLFSTHMLQHMTMSMIAPLFLVLASPITLALRTLAPRGDGSRGAREWLLAVLHSRWGRTVTHPVVAAAIFTGSLMLFYYSPLFGLALRTHYGHEAMHVHFLLSGYLFVWSLVGTDPGVRTTPYPLRLIVLFATMAFHAFFGVALMESTRILQADFFTVVAAGRGWGPDPLSDQQAGAAIAWGVGEVPTLAVAIAIAVLWLRDDTREARRKDRQADRDGDAELRAYNAMLARLGGDQVGGEQGGGDQGGGDQGGGDQGGGDQSGGDQSGGDQSGGDQGGGDQGGRASDSGASNGSLERHG